MSHEIFENEEMWNSKRFERNVLRLKKFLIWKKAIAYNNKISFEKNVIIEGFWRNMESLEKEKGYRYL